jgi:sugar phosphate permease
LFKRIKIRSIYFGWWTVLTGGVIHLWIAGFHTYGFSALFKPISSELGFSRAVTSVPASIARLEGGLEAPVTGWMTDRFGPRWIIFFGVLLVGIGFILMNYVNSLWSFYVVWGVVAGIGHNIATSIPVDKAISDWFVKKRGLAISMKWLCSGLSGVLVLPLVAWLITVQGWRTTCVIGGVVMLLVGLPMAWFLVKQHRPEYYGLLPDGAKAEEGADASETIERGVQYAAEVQEIEFTLRQAMKTPAFWLLILANAGHSLALPAFNIHLVPFLTDMGIEPLRAAGMMAFMIGSSIPGRLIAGLMADRVSKNRLRFILGVIYVMQAVGVALFLIYKSLAMVYVWFILYGMGRGAGFTLLTPLRARYFGRKAYGSIQGTSMLIMTPVVVAAPVYVGWMYDTTGSYMTAFTVVAALLALSASIAFFILPPKPPAEISDIHKIA